MGRRFPRPGWILAGGLAMVALAIWTARAPERRRNAEVRRLLVSEAIRPRDLPPQEEWKTLGADAVPVLQAALLAPGRTFRDVLADYARLLGLKPAAAMPAFVLRSAAARVSRSLGTNAQALLPALIRAQELQSMDSEITDRLREFGPAASNAIPVLLRQFEAQPGDPALARAILAVGMSPADWELLAGNARPGIRLTGRVGLCLSRGETNQALNHLRDAMMATSTLSGLAGFISGDLGRVAAPLAGTMVEQTVHSRRQHRVFWIERLGDLGPGAAVAVDRLVQILDHDPDPEVRQAAIRSLGRIGAPARPALPRLEALRHGDDESQIWEAREAVERIEGAATAGP